MHVEMAATWLGAVRVALLPKFDRNRHEVAVMHSALGGDVLGDLMKVTQRAPQHRKFHAAVMVQVHMQRCDG